MVQPTEHPQRLILMGTGPFAVPSFDALRQAGHEIALVVTKPQPPIKSRRGPAPAPVRQWAQSHSLPIDDPVSINDEDAVARLGDIAADLLVVCDYGQILKPPALQSAKRGGINLHGSLLPRYRGAAPVQWALLSGDAMTGVSVIHMTPRLDGGPILTLRETPIGDHETAGELEERLAQIGVDATLQAVEMLHDWDGQEMLGQPQQSDQVSKAPRLQKADGEIDWGRTAREIDCHVRGMLPWPGAFTHLQVSESKPPLRLAVRSMEILPQSSNDHCTGEVISDGGFIVATTDRLVKLTRVQPAGKKEMAGEDFLRGHQPPEGTRLF